MNIQKGWLLRVFRFGLLGLSICGSAPFAAESRSYFNLLWGNPDASLVDSRYADMSWFRAHSTHAPYNTPKDLQPPGYSILQISYIYNDPLVASDVLGQTAQLEAALRSYGYDWSRIVAVVVDEPYWIEGDRSPPCWLRNNDSREARILQTARYLENAAAAVKNVSNSKTLFWVNFGEPEITWMMYDVGYFPYIHLPLISIERQRLCGGIHLNRDYIDIISMDKYDASFYSGVKIYYDFLLSTRSKATQKIALVPGMFYSTDANLQEPMSPTTSATWQNEYFMYADGLNSQCNFDAVKAAISGAQNPCPVWAVVGWEAESGPKYNAGLHRTFMFADSAKPILDEWKRHLGVTARTRAALQPVLGLFH